MIIRLNKKVKKESYYYEDFLSLDQFLPSLIRYKAGDNFNILLDYNGFTKELKLPYLPSSIKWMDPNFPPRNIQDFTLEQCNIIEFGFDHMNEEVNPVVFIYKTH